MGAEILDLPSGLTDRAVSFLKGHAVSQEQFRGASDDDVRREVSTVFGVDGWTFIRALRAAQDRYGGLQYRSIAWSFEESILFDPQLDIDMDDPAPMIDLVRHSVAHPFGVWMAEDGSVSYLLPGESGGEYLKVFKSCDALIEADAMYTEVDKWQLVDHGSGESAFHLYGAMNGLSIVNAPSGFTEWWWQGDGFRVHIWFTYAQLFGRNDLARWAVWANDSAGEAAGSTWLSHLGHRS